MKKYNSILFLILSLFLVGCGSTTYTFKSNEVFDYELSVGDWSVEDRTDLLKLRVKDSDSLVVIINGVKVDLIKGRANQIKSK